MVVCWIVSMGINRLQEVVYKMFSALDSELEC